MTINEIITQLRSLRDNSADIACKDDNPLWKDNVEALSAALEVLTPERQQVHDAQEMALRDALQEVHHAAVLVSYGCEGILAKEIAKGRGGMLAALILAEQALQERICGVMAGGDSSDA